MYTLRIYEPYEKDEVLQFETVDEAISHIKKRKLFLDDCSLYKTPTEIDLYSVMRPKYDRTGGRAI